MKQLNFTTISIVRPMSTTGLQRVILNVLDPKKFLIIMKKNSVMQK